MAEDVFDIAEVDALYGMPLADFVAARDALAKRLRSEGERDAAAQVKRLAKPSVAAGALNQVVRDHPDEVAALLEVGDEVRAHQASAVGGGDPGPLREATKRRRALLQALVGRSVALAGGTHGEEVRAMLDVASLDVDRAPALRHGRMTGAVTAPGGFGFGFGDLDEPEDEADQASSQARHPATGKARAAKTEPRSKDKGREERRAGARDAAARLAAPAQAGPPEGKGTKAERTAAGGRGAAASEPTPIKRRAASRDDAARRRAAEEEATRFEQERVERVARIAQLTEALDRANDDVVEAEERVRAASAALSAAEEALADARRTAAMAEERLAEAPTP